MDIEKFRRETIERLGRMSEDEVKELALCIAVGSQAQELMKGLSPEGLPDFLEVDSAEATFSVSGKTYAMSMRFADEED